MGTSTMTSTVTTTLHSEQDGIETLHDQQGREFELLPLPRFGHKHTGGFSMQHPEVKSSNDFIDSVELGDHNTMTLRDHHRRLSTNSREVSGLQVACDSEPGDLPPLAPTTSGAPSIHPHASQVRLKLLSCFLCTFVAGLNDGSLGALVPYILEEYKISESHVGIIYATSFLGWAIGALLMPLAMRYCGGLRGTLLLGAFCQFSSYMLRFWIPPYPLFAVTFFQATLGQAFQDAQSNTFISTLQDKHLWLGFLHAMWSLGTLVAPLIATSIASSEAAKTRDLKWGWAVYYVIPLAVAVTNIALVLIAFYRGPNVDPSLQNGGDDTTMSQEAGNHQSTTGAPVNKISLKVTMKEELLEAMRLKVFWLIGLFFFFHLAAAMTIGGWIVVYLTDHRGMPLEKAGYVPTGYFAGLFLGRLLLPQPTNSWLGGEHYMLMLYSAILFALQIISWFVPSAIATATVMSAMGFFFGPFFAAGVKVASDIFPRKVKTSALGLVFVIAQLGGSVVPAITGVIAAQVGVKVLQPLAVAMIILMGVSWWMVPKADRRGGWRE